MKYGFSTCELDVDAHALTRDGDVVHVEPQVFTILRMLVEASGDLVTYDQLVEAVWQGRHVSDATIAARISAARAAVGDSGQRQEVIQTIARCGIRLVVPVVEQGEVAQNAQVDPNAGTLQPTAIRQTVRMAQSEDGTMLAWSKIGDGPPLVRAGHWLTHLEQDLKSAIWGPWIERLSRNRTLVRYDPRGTGLSARDCGAISVDNAVADLKAVLDAAGVERFSILAASQSAAIAFHFAARYPERIDRIVTYGAFVQGTRVREPEVGSTFADALGLMIRNGWGKPDSGYLRSLGTLFMPSASEAELSELLHLQSASASAERAIEIRECCSHYDEVAVLREVEAPVLVAHALRDSVHPFSQAQLIAATLPNAQLLQLDSANHVFTPRDPAFDILMDEMDAFLA
jgi:pimeloyl-ACP methyl ester carboxylesterase/DNA-binding winged helix-turn-helix (wHTH) protein